MLCLMSRILNEVKQFESSQIPISQIAYQENFEIFEQPPSFDRHKYFHAEKKKGDYKIILTMERRNQRLGYDNQEPFHNKVCLYKHGYLIESKSYTYYA